MSLCSINEFYDCRRQILPSRRNAAELMGRTECNRNLDQAQPREQEADRDDAEQCDRHQRLEGRQRHRAVEAELRRHRIATLQHQGRRIDEDEGNDVAGKRDPHRFPADLVRILLGDRRRRQCGACDKRFTTYERPEVNFPAIVKKDGRRIEYERVKLRASMNLALRKRPVSIEQVDSAIERIEEKLLNLAQREVASNKIGELVMRELKKLDKVAYVRFASVYRSFEDIDDFKLLVDEVSK